MHRCSAASQQDTMIGDIINTLSKSSLTLGSFFAAAHMPRIGSVSSTVSGSEVETRMKLLVETGSTNEW